MTDPVELVGRLETYADPHEEMGMTYVRAALTEAAACIREMVEWRPIETAPRDGRYILAVMRVHGEAYALDVLQEVVALHDPHGLAIRDLPRLLCAYILRAKQGAGE